MRSWPLLLYSIAFFLAACEPIAFDRAAFGERTLGSDHASLTADLQPLGGSDMHIAREIRQQVLRAHALSLAARNVKIIVLDGNVTLRGPVVTLEEKVTIGAIARGLAPGRVLNELTVRNARAT